MSAALARYRELEVELRTIRARAGRGGAEEEMPTIEAMSRVWFQLTDAEREQLDAEGPTCDPPPHTCAICQTGELVRSKEPA